MKIRVLIFACFLLFGCATTSWHKKQLAEIEESYANKEITKAEYLQLKISLANSKYLKDAANSANDAAYEATRTRQIIEMQSW